MEKIDHTKLLIDEMRTIVATTPGIDPKIYRLLDECERRLHNGSDTIGAYQELTNTDYPGTLKRHIEIGRVTIKPY